NIFFFFQAEDGIRDYKVTGVQTCALPISKTEKHDLSYQDGFFTTCFQSCHSFQKRMASGSWDEEGWRARVKYMRDTMMAGERAQIGRASGRGRVEIAGAGGGVRRKGSETV